MFYLVATILLNVLLSAIFKLFPRYGINTLQAIVANYVVCVVTGTLFLGHSPFTAATASSSWLPWAVLMGAGFVTVFNLLATSTRVDGITITTIANKLSLVIPALFSVWWYHEQVGLGKVVGILIAFPAIYLTTRTGTHEKKPASILLPVLIFIGGGMLDTLMKFVQTYYLASRDDQAAYAIICFATAGSIGVVLIGILLLLKKTTLHWRNLLAGICVGIPNYFSIYFLIRLLNSNLMQSSAAIPVLNIGILVVSAVAAMLFFKEKAGPIRLAGLLLSVVAILLIAFGDRH